MSYDIAIVGGRVLDGTGNPWFREDIAIKGERIAKLGKVDIEEAEKVIDASGLIITPGFIDMHSHSEFTLLINGRAESKIRQGVTTEVNGNCGFSSAPMGEKMRDYLLTEAFQGEIMRKANLDLDWRTMEEYLNKIEEKGIALNEAVLAGYGNLRISVMGFEDRLANSDEVDQMKSLLDQCIQDGAVGMSTGLTYPPQLFSTTKELVELAKVTAQHGRIYATHMRGGGKGLEEAIEISRKANVPIEVSHCRSESAYKILDNARAEMVRITTDFYSYTAGCGPLTPLLPPWTLSGGMEKMAERLSNPGIRPRIKEEMMSDEATGIMKGVREDFDRILIALSHAHPEYEGLTVPEIAEKTGKEALDVILDFLMEDKNKVYMIVGPRREEDPATERAEEGILAAVRSPYASFGSDGTAIAPYGVLSSMKHMHPRYYGAAVRLIKRYVIERKLISIQEAVRKLTYLPARILGLVDRGLIKGGMYADIVVINEKKLADNAVWKTPYLYPSGVDCVIVNGKIVIEKGEHTGRLPGKALRSYNPI